MISGPIDNLRRPADTASCLTRAARAACVRDGLLMEARESRRLLGKASGETARDTHRVALVAFVDLAITWHRVMMDELREIRD